ncbi:hypothetical protein [Streptomyces sp. AC550_RSS872]|uniref:hypothetical protein n=1 Tax=Streptomyces sp. AC550_RSS872 TaxID=2823689 RepID=UPI0020B87A00|nr:hypothetical protein [Streptomyces sp. AC550_RSS872]
MTCGVLPAVDKYLCSFQRWLPGHLARIADPGHDKTIKLFATWRVLPRLRARAERSHITPSVRRFAAEQIKYATAFLQWLGKRNSTPASCGQNDIDAWWAGTPSTAAPACEPSSAGQCRAAVVDAPSLPTLHPAGSSPGAGRASRFAPTTCLRS